MSASLNPSPPENENARLPAKKVEREQDATTGTDAQLPTSENAHLSIIKQWLRCENQTRRALLRDIKFAHPDLWRQVAEEAV